MATEPHKVELGRLRVGAYRCRRVYAGLCACIPGAIADESEAEAEISASSLPVTTDEKGD